DRGASVEQPAYPEIRLLMPTQRTFEDPPRPRVAGRWERAEAVRPRHAGNHTRWILIGSTSGRLAVTFSSRSYGEDRPTTASRGPVGRRTPPSVRITLS